MKKSNYRNLGFTAILALCFLTACTTGNGSNKGVAHIENRNATSVPNESLVHASSDSNVSATFEAPSGGEPSSVDSSNKSDEQIVTEFSACMRDRGWKIPDPELEADGTINFRAMLSTVWQTPGFDRNNREDLDACLPILQNIGFAGQRPSEDEIELEDNLLNFAQCLRDSGLSVPDPDFSAGGRGAMRPLIQALDLNDTDVEESLATCREQTFGGQGAGRGRGNNQGSTR
jgi:hypothetical protein